MFSGLQQPAFFTNLQVEPGNYAIMQNEKIDMSEYRLWKNGVMLESGDLAYNRPSDATMRATAAIAGSF